MGKDTLQLQKKLLDTYDGELDKEGISGKRLAKRLDALSQIGRTKENGSNRPGFSREEKAAKSLVMQWMEEAGLAVRMDGAGNVIGRLEGRRTTAPAILSGSHVDTVPNGGHFDGALGVVTALEVAESWKATNYLPEKPYEVIVFTDEEGTRLQDGLSGSEAMMGKVDLEGKLKRSDNEGMFFEEVLENIGLSVASYMSAKRPLTDIETFVEVHIEQGKRLEKEGLPCGIVTGIAGPHWMKFTFEGEAGHAGNTPMNDRQDALVAASDFIQTLQQLPSKVNDSAVATVGKIQVEPNGVNVIPGKVTLYVDLRDIYADSRQELFRHILQLGEEISQKHSIEVTHEDLLITPPVPISESRQEKVKKAFEENGLYPFYLPSGAGHDSQIVGSEHPVAMIFVQSKNGISHNPAEWSSLSDCIQATHVLKTYIEDLQSLSIN